MFGKDERLYEIEGLGKLPSVTTILGSIAKPALYMWYAKKGETKAVQILEQLKALSPEIYDRIISGLPADFLKGGKDLLQEAANVGSLAHGIIERILKGLDWSFDAIPGEAIEQVRNSVNAFMEFRKQNELEVIKTEFVCWSKLYGYAGTTDCIARTKHGITLIDWKTGGIYPEARLQTVAYRMAVEEMSNEKIDHVMICRFAKTDGKFQIEDVLKASHENHYKVFLGVLETYKWLKKNPYKRAA